MKFTNSTIQSQTKIQIEDLEGFEELSEIEASSIVGGADVIDGRGISDFTFLANQIYKLGLEKLILK